MHFSRILLTVGGLILAAPVLAAPAQIELSHQLDEERAARFEPLIERFNGQQKDVQIKLVRRVEGDAPKQLNLVTREEHSRFLANKAKFKPIGEVMREAKQTLDASKLAPELRFGVTDAKGQLLALPLAYSTPVLFINKAAFRKAGLNPDMPPKTWAEAQEAAGKLVDAGSRCAYTTSWPAWVHIDNLSAWDGAPVADAKGNLEFNGLVQVKHVAMMATWAKSKYFTYFGRRDEADRRFANGECGMLTSASSLVAILGENKSLDYGVSSFPYHDDVRGAPQSTLADGSSLWVGGTVKPTEAKGVAAFVNYLLSPDLQVEMTVAGGFLPMSSAARAAMGSKLLKADLLGQNVAAAQLKGKMSPSVRVSQVEQVRIIVEEELENVWSDKKPAKEALDNAVQRGNAVMQPQPVAAKAKGKSKSKSSK